MGGRSKDAFQERPGYGIFGIVQGNIFEDLREESAKGLTGIGFDGYAIGGLAVGEPQNEMFMTLDFTVPHLPHGQPRYLMGVGTPADIVGAVERGIDMFDCVMPTSLGAHRGRDSPAEESLTFAMPDTRKTLDH